MPNSEALKMMQSVKAYMTSGNPIWSVTEIGEAFDMAIEALEQPEIIRCGQCKYAEVADKEDAQDGYTCQFHRGSIWFSGSYCSWAERRSDETD